MNGSELLLNNAERYGIVLARAVEAPRKLSRPNIGMTLVFIYVSKVQVIGCSVFIIISECYNE